MRSPHVRARAGAAAVLTLLAVGAVAVGAGAAGAGAVAGARLRAPGHRRRAGQRADRSVERGADQEVAARRGDARTRRSIVFQLDASGAVDVNTASLAQRSATRRCRSRCGSGRRAAARAARARCSRSPPLTSSVAPGAHIGPVLPVDFGHPSSSVGRDDRPQARDRIRARCCTTVCRARPRSPTSSSTAPSRRSASSSSGSTATCCTPPPATCGCRRRRSSASARNRQVQTNQDVELPQARSHPAARAHARHAVGRVLPVRRRARR